MVPVKSLPVKLPQFVVAIGLSFGMLLPWPSHAERSPIFGSATIEALSPDAARDITARGDWANYYGGLAVTYSYSAYVFAYYARHFAVSNSAQEQNWYATAASHAYYAYLFATWAYNNSAAGL